MDKSLEKVMKYRWLIWGILVFAYVIVFFHRLAVGVVRDDLVDAFAISGTTYALLGSMYFYPYMIMQIPSGMLADSLGARKTVTIGVLVSGVGSVIFGMASTIAMAFVGRVMVGLGVSVVFISILKIQSQWFKESEFGTMSGLTSFVGNMGGIVAQTPLALLVAAITWRNAFIVIGGISVVVAALIYLLVRNSPVDMGLPAVNEAKEQIDQKGKPVNLLEGLKKVVTNIRIYPGFFMYAGFFGSFVALTGTWGRSYMVDVYGISKISASNYMAAVVLGTAIGSVVLGRWSDKIKRRKLPMLVYGFVHVLTWGILVFVNGGKPPLDIMYPLLFINGFTLSTFILTWACSKEINPPEFAGISTSVINVGGFMGAAILPPMMGRVFDAYGGMLPTVELYQRAFMYCFSAVLIGFVLLFLIKETHCRNIYGLSEKESSTSKQAA